VEVLPQPRPVMIPAETVWHQVIMLQNQLWLLVLKIHGNREQII
jgi:hypothetical protein